MLMSENKEAGPRDLSMSGCQVIVVCYVTRIERVPQAKLHRIDFFQTN